MLLQFEQASDLELMSIDQLQYQFVLHQDERRNLLLQKPLLFLQLISMGEVRCRLFSEQLKLRQLAQ